MMEEMTLEEAVKIIEDYTKKKSTEMDELISYMFANRVAERLEKDILKKSIDRFGIVASSSWVNDRIGSDKTMVFIVKKGNTMTRITANAYVHPANVPVRPDTMSRYIVDVYGVEPHDYVRTYTIEAKHDKDASAEALRRFSNEITVLLLSREET